ncbi:dinucleoside polyphosphate hydrolase [Neoasaia chiangmaiensis NBRC 101099]|uniref:RNA pyrophosphohydrolase n=1 Tax=Neoasaia chiangmaiensis TaxID=320497 RepID=A0A1U9KP40_9PROT|nr:RNA pyrophosphohydrolase [Neoasaia chiangmaiensis]AQS87572.1 RNA pyrophosphohydrolase [Neoasaia chiangmaiensis]GBR42223.1 dinucleoside polyphosphate hydrolase [Neoasaia chiangmaiensis NBRC 101099]GEN14126.1 RNA pyrophosphohydrolase [Neoasaia chiangmaiensis]
MIDLSSLPYRPNVGAMLFDARGHIFLARRADLPDGIWQCPQGGIDPGETPEEAVRRELEEEIGTTKAEILGEYPEWLSYDLPPHLIGKALGGQFRGQTQRWFALRFLGSDSDVVLDRHLPAEFDQWAWVPPDEIASFNLGFKKILYATLVPALSRMASPL